MMEKAKKTVSYLKGHYRVIFETKEKIKSAINELSQEYENMIILKSDDEIGQIVQIALSEYHSKNNSMSIKVFNETFDDKTTQLLMNAENAVLVYAVEDMKLIDELKSINKVEIVNLIERL